MKNAGFPEMGCVIMASGLGRRFGGNKLLEDFGGEAMLCRILSATQGIFGSRIVVTRSPEVKDLCEKKELSVILHTFPGRNDTIRLGVETLEPSVKQIMFCPGDQPLLRRETVMALAAAAASEPCFIRRTKAGEMMGLPAVFPEELFPELKTLPEGKGGGILIRRYPDRVRYLEVSQEELLDADTREEFARLLALYQNRDH